MREGGGGGIGWMDGDGNGGGDGVGRRGYQWGLGQRIGFLWGGG